MMKNIFYNLNHIEKIINENKVSNPLKKGKVKNKKIFC